MNKTIASEKYRSVLSWLKTSREEKGLSMRDLAKILDTPHSFIQKIESGERRLDIYEYCQYCKALNIDPNPVFQNAGIDPDTLENPLFRISDVKLNDLWMNRWIHRRCLDMHMPVGWDGRAAEDLVRRTHAKLVRGL